ncbi:MAG: hypothetical protein IIU23_05530, partial [Bacteroidales bacterium]|nr:hypothetical protein [Bacteroidales bacterium]
MKRFLAYMAVLALAFACAKTPEPAPEEETHQHQESSAPSLKSITIIDSIVTLEPGGSAPLHFTVEDPDCQLQEVTL